MSIVRLCPYDVNGENCKYETHYGEPNFSKCKNCDRTSNICKTSKTILKGDKKKMTKEQEFRKQTEEAKFEAFALMCKKVADLERENAELKRNEFNARSCLELQQSQDKAILNHIGDQLNKAKEIMNIAIEGIKCWGIVGGNERPLEKQAEMLFNLFLDKAEQFIKDNEVKKVK